MIYTPKHYRVEEWFPQDVLDWCMTTGYNPWMFIDERILMTGDRLRARYGTMYLNNYLWGGKSQYRGYRPPTCQIGSTLSAHRFGKAGDFNPVKVTAEEIRLDIKANWKKGVDLFPFITRIENNVNWFHCDNFNANRITWFNG